jgi:hypothetical protein
MKKTIKIDDEQKFEINSSSGWLYAYQEQFGHDVLPVLLPAAEALLQTMADLMKDSKSDNVGDMLANADEETISNAFITLSGMQLTTVTNIVWAMAKNANDNIESPREWLNSFDVFPWDIVVPQVLGAALEACINKKKFDKLKETIKIPNRFQSNESQ